MALSIIEATQATVYNCSTTQEILNALSLAQAGDEIIIDAGTYVSSSSTGAAYYYSSADGTAANPITIRSNSSTNKAHLKGSSISSGTVLRIEGDYWIVKDLEISTGLKALVFDNSNHSTAINCDLHNVGNEALHVRDGSDYVTIDGCNIYNTGNVNPGYGEGIYIGTDKGSWDKYDPYCDYTTVKNCTIGPNVRAETLDIKEGTQETVVEYNTLNATGISGANYSDSFIDLKGVRTYVRYNTFNRNGESTVDKGIAAVNRSVELSCYEHAIHDNVFNMDIASNNILEAYAGTSEVYGWNNTRNPSGDDYNSRVIESCPSWYTLCGGNQNPTVSITSPQNGDTFPVASNITIDASANDNDGSISSVKFLANGTLLGTDTSSPYSYIWTGATAGSHTITVEAEDNEGAVASSSISINVTSGNIAPTVSLTTPQSNETFSEGADITLAATASDSDGTIARVAFYYGTTLIAEDTSSPYSVVWSGASVGTHSLTAQATDNDGAITVSTSVAVSVTPNSVSDVSLEYYASDTDPVNNKIRPYIKLFNNSGVDIPFEDLTIRYWFTEDADGPLTFQCDYADIGNSNVTGVITEMVSAENTADHYLEVGFATAAGNLSQGSNSGQIKLRITKTGGVNFDETNDYSYDATINSYTENQNITVYQNGALIWGSEPSVAPPTVNDLSIEYYSADTDPSNNKIRPYLQIINNDATDVPYEDLKIRYWFTKDVTSALQFQCDYADLGTSFVQGSYTTLSNTSSEADHYLEVTFDAAAGSLLATDDSGKIKLRITNSDNSNFDESNDYSFDGSYSGYTLHDKITLYQNDQLVWGTEPIGATARESDVLTHSAPATPKISVFPNPASRYISLQTDTYWYDADLKIIDMAGMLIVATTVKQNDMTKLDIASLKQGSYVLLLTKNGQTLTQKFIKK